MIETAAQSLAAFPTSHVTLVVGITGLFVGEVKRVCYRTRITLCQVLLETIQTVEMRFCRFQSVIVLKQEASIVFVSVCCAKLVHCFCICVKIRREAKVNEC